MKDVPLLKEITVEITQRCLQNCVHCSSVATYNSHQFLTKDEIVRIGQDFARLGGETMELSGGEPLLHNEVFDIIPILKSMGLKINVFTCGEITNDDNFEDAIKKTTRLLKSQDINELVFSLHGAHAETHDDIVRRKNSFYHATKFIQELVAEKVPVGIHFVPMSPNFEEFGDLVEFAARLGVEEITVLRFVPQGRGRQNEESLMLDKETVSKLIELLTESEKRKDIRINIGSHLDFTFLLDGYSPKRCMAGITKCLIESNGDVIPCAVFKGMKDSTDDNYVAGNVKKASLYDIWRAPETFEKFRTFDPKLLKGECKTCQYLEICRGRCPAQRVYDHGDFYQGPDKYCPKEFFQKRVSNEGTSR
jgi:radical SAM protein with 4Fe4S-binding SPASM domain